MTDLEKLIEEIEAYAKIREISPSTVFRYATSAGSNRYAKILSGEADMTTKGMQRIRNYMSDAE